MAEKFVDAVPHEQIEWESINWKYHEDVVRRLQARIVKATEEGNWRKVHNLQRLLTHSRSGKLLAVKRVTENEGSKTPGVDKMTWQHPRSKEMAVTLLRPRGYKPQPLRRILIPKSNGKMRPLGIPTMLDRAMQALHLLALDPVAETLADPNSYGFRVGRSCADAIEQCFKLLCGGRDRWILEADIKGCFDHISHDWLLEHIPMERSSITHLSEGFDFLGQNVRAFGNKTITQPSKKNVATFLKKIRTHIIIRGWANYHRHACSKATFDYVDAQIFKCLMWWTKRRHKHDHKNMHWIVDKYFGSCGNQHWRFFGDGTTSKGASQRYWLAQAAHTPIVRHTKVKAIANPYSIDGQKYFAQRRNKRKGKEQMPDTNIYDTQLSFTFGLRTPRPIWGV